jgi:hypothetical protein
MAKVKEEKKTGMNTERKVCSVKSTGAFRLKATSGLNGSPAGGLAGTSIDASVMATPLTQINSVQAASPLVEAAIGGEEIHDGQAEGRERLCKEDKVIVKAVVEVEKGDGFVKKGEVRCGKGEGIMEMKPKATVKRSRPKILTHIIEGFIIQEATEPFPVSALSVISVNRIRLLCYKS